MMPQASIAMPAMAARPSPPSPSEDLHPRRGRLLGILVALLALEEAVASGSGFSQGLLLCFETLTACLAAVFLLYQRPRQRLAVYWGLALLSDGLGVALLAWTFVVPSGSPLYLIRDLLLVFMRIFAALGYLALPERHRPSPALWCYGLVISGLSLFLVWAGLQIPHFAWYMTLSTLIDGMLLLCGLPWLQGVLAGQAPSSRLLWILGWHLFWVTHCQVALEQILMGHAAWGEPPPSSSAFLAATFCLCLGYMAEVRRWDLGLWPFMLALGIVTLAWVRGLIFYHSATPLVFGFVWLGLGGFTFLVTSLGLLQAYFAARDRSLALLEQHNEALGRARSAKNVLLASMSHELRTPLNAIIGFADALEDGLLGSLDALQRDWAGEIHRAGTQLLHLVERILMLAKLEAGRQTFQVVPLDLGALLREQAPMLQRRCAAAGNRLLCLMDQTLPAVKADPAQLGAALGDLLDDALQTLTVHGGQAAFVVLHAQWLSPDRVTITCTNSRPAAVDNLRTTGDAGEVTYPTLPIALLHERMARQGGHARLIHHPGSCRTVVLELPVADSPEKNTAPPKGERQPRSELHLEPAPRWFMPMGLVLFGMASCWLMVGGASAFRLFALLASGVTCMLAWRAGGALRWLGVGFGCYALGNFWATAASFFPAIPYAWRWPFFHAGYLFFCLGLWRLKPRALPRWTLAGFGLLCLMALYPLSLLLQQGHWLGIHIRYPLLELITLGFAMPGLEAALRGHAAPGRLLWIFAFFTSFFTELVSSLLYCPTCPDPYGTLDIIFIVFFVNTLCGVWAESRRWELRYSPLVLGVGGFMIVWIIEMLALRSATTQHAAVSYYYWVCSGGLVLFLGAMIVLEAHHARAGIAQASLRRASRELADANRAQTNFLATLSHQLRTPLHTVLGFAGLLGSNATDTLASEAKEAVAHIRRAGEHLLSLLNDIIDLSAIETGGDGLGGRPPRPTAIDIPELIDNSMALLRERARKRHITMHAHVDTAHASIWRTDERTLKQIIFNYLSNAVKFTPEQGQVSIHIAHVHDLTPFCGLAGFEMPRSTSPQGYLQLSVTDSGMGIAPEDQARLFQPFSQTQAGRAQAEGTGLGLALVKRLAKALGGAVGVQSEPGQGSTFHAWLPWMA